MSHAADCHDGGLQLRLFANAARIRCLRRQLEQLMNLKRQVRYLKKTIQVHREREAIEALYLLSVRRQVVTRNVPV